MARVVQCWNMRNTVIQRSLTVLLADARNHYHLQKPAAAAASSAFVAASSRLLWQPARLCSCIAYRSPSCSAPTTMQRVQRGFNQTLCPPPSPLFLVWPVYLGERNHRAAVVTKNTRCQKHATAGIENLTVAGPRALHVPELDTTPPMFLSALLYTFAFCLSQDLPLLPSAFLQLCNYKAFNSERRCFC